MPDLARLDGWRHAPAPLISRRQAITGESARRCL